VGDRVLPMPAGLHQHWLLLEGLDHWKEDTLAVSGRRAVGFQAGALWACLWENVVQDLSQELPPCQPLPPPHTPHPRTPTDWGAATRGATTPSTTAHLLPPPPHLTHTHHTHTRPYPTHHPHTRPTRPQPPPHPHYAT